MTLAECMKNIHLLLLFSEKTKKTQKLQAMWKDSLMTASIVFRENKENTEIIGNDHRLYNDNLTCFQRKQENTENKG